MKPDAEAAIQEAAEKARAAIHAAVIAARAAGQQSAAAIRDKDLRRS